LNASLYFRRFKIPCAPGGIIEEMSHQALLVYDVGGSSFDNDVDFSFTLL
jgi:hypothetical protein